MIDVKVRRCWDEERHKDIIVFPPLKAKLVGFYATRDDVPRVIVVTAPGTFIDVPLAGIEATGEEAELVASNWSHA